MGQRKQDIRYKDRNLPWKIRLLGVNNINGIYIMEKGDEVVEIGVNYVHRCERKGKKICCVK